MSQYVVPQVLVFQEFNLIPQATLRQLCAHIAGGHAWLVRHSESTEKEIGNLGYYADDLDSHYTWPQRPAGGVVDPGYTKVFMEDVELLEAQQASIDAVPGEKMRAFDIDGGAVRSRMILDKMERAQQTSAAAE